MPEPHSPDLEAYFARIGYTGPRTPTLVTLNAIAEHHTATIPFENLDVLLGRGINLDLVAIERKIVHNQRGGYCFEQNFLLMTVLLKLGFHAVPLSARVRWQRARDFTPPRTHVFIRVDLDGECWLMDAGVGGLSLTSAIRLDTEAAQTTPHDTRRIIHEDGRYFHQVRIGADWQDVCEFTGEEMPAIDRELANWYTSAHPQSHFRNRLIVARAAANRERYALLNHEFTHRRADGQGETRLLTTPDELLMILESHFGLHFPAGTRFGPPGSAWPS